MPFKSEAQRRFMFARHPVIARRWANETKAKKRKQKAAIFAACKLPAEPPLSLGDVLDDWLHKAAAVLTGYDDEQPAVSPDGTFGGDREQLLAAQQPVATAASPPPEALQQQMQAVAATAQAPGTAPPAVSLPGARQPAQAAAPPAAAAPAPNMPNMLPSGIMAPAHWQPSLQIGKAAILRVIKAH